MKQPTFLDVPSVDVTPDPPNDESPIDAPPVDTTYHEMTELKQTDESAEEATLSCPPNRPISFEVEEAQSLIPPERRDCPESRS